MTAKADISNLITCPDRLRPEIIFDLGDGLELSVGAEDLGAGRIRGSTETLC